MRFISIISSFGKIENNLQIRGLARSLNSTKIYFNITWMILYHAFEFRCRMGRKYLVDILDKFYRKWRRSSIRACVKNIHYIFTCWRHFFSYALSSLVPLGRRKWQIPEGFQVVATVCRSRS